MNRVVSARTGTGSVFDVRTVSGTRMVVEPGAKPPSAAGPGPMELMLVSLSTCAGSTLCEVLGAMRRPFDGLEVLADGERAGRPPRVWTAIHLRFHVRGDLSRDRLEHALGIVARTCSAWAMLRQMSEISWSVVLVHPAPAATTRELRQRILRPHQTLQELVVPGEEDPSAAWFVAETARGEVVGTAGVFPEAPPEPPDGEGIWRLRSMAVDERHRGTGVGRMLLDACLDHLAGRGGRLLWCSARLPAVGFYESAGFEVVGDVYEVPAIGPHVRMTRPVA